MLTKTPHKVYLKYLILHSNEYFAPEAAAYSSVAQA